MPKNAIYAGGLTLNFFESPDFEEDLKNDSPEDARIKARNILRLIMMGWNKNWHTLCSRDIVKAIFVKRDYRLLGALRLAFQEGFDHLFTQLESRDLPQQKHNQAQLFISNCLSYLPFADITPFESFAIPQYVAGRWQQIDYKVIPIELTPNSGFKKLFLAENDRVFAYGLEPINHMMAEPRLIFMATTYPAGQGFVSTLNTDLEAFETVGKKLYRTGTANIYRWLDQQAKKVQVCGASLGGGLSLLLAIDQGDKLSRVDAFNPPGLYDSWRKSRFDHWDELQEKPDVYIQKQANDPVSCLGVWKPDWHVLDVVPPERMKNYNRFLAHTINYAGFSDTQYRKIDSKKDNKQRKLRNFWIYTLLRSLVYYTAAVPFRYLTLPLIRFVASHKLQFTLTIFFTKLFSLYSMVPLGATSAFIINGLFPAVAAGYLSTDVIQFITDRMTHEGHSDLSKFIHFMAARPQQYRVLLAAFLAVTAASVTAVTVFPPLTSGVIHSLATLPLFCSLLHKVADNLSILLGYNDIKIPAFLHPARPKNESLDIYRQDVEVRFTYKEIHHYYRNKRELKGKPFLPEEYSPKLFKSIKHTKREVLIKSQDEAFHAETITFITSKAKAHDMRRTLRFIECLGPEKLMPELERSHQDYAFGQLKQ